MSLVPLAPPPADVEYPHLLRRPGREPVLMLLTAMLGCSGFVLLPTLVSTLVVWLGWLLRGQPGSLGDHSRAATRFELPEGMLAAHLGLATLILVTLACLRWGAGLAPRWVCSVQPGMRWRYLLLAMVVSFVVLGAGVWLTQLRDAGAPHPQAGFGWFLLVILLTTPLQAAAEELFFRGFLLTLVGSAFRQVWVGVVVSALLFALVHGTQSAPLFVDRLVFGLLAGALVVKTGGLEAGIAAHVVNNLLAFTAAGMWRTISEARTMTTITWAQAAGDVATFAVVALATWALGRVLQVATRTPRDAAAGLA